MEERIYEVGQYKHSIKNWWLMLLLGLAMFVVGVVVFRHPGETYMAMAYTFAVLVIITGLVQLYLAYFTPPHGGRGWLIAGGVVELFLGILMIAQPDAMAAVIPFLLGFWLLFRSIMLIGSAGDMMAHRIKGAGWIVTLSVLLLICAFMVLFNPVIGAGAIVVWIGLSFLLAGVAMVVYSIYLMRLRKHL